MFQQSVRTASWVALPLSVALVTGFSPTAQAASFGVADDYNVFVFGDMTQSSDAEGRVAVGGNATFTNFGIGDRLPNSNGADTRLVVGGDLTYNGGQVFGGGAVVGGQVNTNVYFNCTPNCGVTQGNPIDFQGARSYLTGLSSYIGSFTPTGTTEYKWDGIWLQGSNADLNVFTIDGSQFGGSSYLELKGVGNSSTVVFNILGETVNIANFGLNLNGLDKSKVLFNFVEATQVQTKGFSFAGSVLATYADFSFNNGNVEGQFIANSVAGSGEFHNIKFNGDLPEYVPPTPEPEPPATDPEPNPDPVAVPEPTALAGLGVVAASLWTRRRRVSI